jgi:hypothetical protein
MYLQDPHPFRPYNPHVLGTAVLLAASLEGHALLLDYGDFAPQAACHTLIGFEWNQWKREGHPEPDDVPVKVVVYRDVARGTVEKAYPVVRAASDHRYVRYDRALRFIDAQLRDWEAARRKDGDAGGGPWDELIARYRKTRRAIEQHAWSR